MPDESLEQLYQQSFAEASTAQTPQAPTQGVQGQPQSMNAAGDQDLESLYQQSFAGEQKTQNPLRSIVLETMNRKLLPRVSSIDRAILSFSDDVGAENYLRKKYDFVRRDPQSGALMVGDQPDQLIPVDPKGIENDFFNDILDGVNLIPVIAGQIIGAGIGAVGGPAGMVAGGAAGAGFGEAINKVIGKSLGVNAQEADEIATDITIASTFGAVGEGLGIALKGATPAMLRKISQVSRRMARTKSPIPAEQSKFVGLLSKVFDISSNVKPGATQAFFKYGDDAVFSKFNLAEGNSIRVAEEIISDIANTRSFLGQAQKESLKRLGKWSSREVINLSDDSGKLFSDLIESGAIDDVTLNINKGIVSEKNDRVIIQKILDQLGIKRLSSGNLEFGTKNYSAEQVLSLQNQLSARFKSLTPKTQRAFTIMRQNLSKKLDNWAVNLKTPKGKEFLEARGNMAKFLSLQDRLESAGFPMDNEFSVERWVGRFYRQEPGILEAIHDMDVLTPHPLLKRIETFAAAQEFRSAKPNLLRLGAVASLIGAGRAETQSEKIGFLGLAVLAGSPAGNKLLLRSGSKGASALRRIATETIVKGKSAATTKVEQNSSRVLLQLLARDLKKRNNQDRRDNRANNKRKFSRV